MRSGFASKISLKSIGALLVEDFLICSRLFQWLENNDKAVEDDIKLQKILALVFFALKEARANEPAEQSAPKLRRSIERVNRDSLD